MNFFGITAPQIRSSREPHFAKFAPLWGVPRNKIPYVETKIDRRCSVFEPRISDEYINAFDKVSIGHFATADEGPYSFNDQSSQRMSNKYDGSFRCFTNLHISLALVLKINPASIWRYPPACSPLVPLPDVQHGCVSYPLIPHP